MPREPRLLECLPVVVVGKDLIPGFVPQFAGGQPECGLKLQACPHKGKWLRPAFSVAIFDIAC